MTASLAPGTLRLSSCTLRAVRRLCWLSRWPTCFSRKIAWATLRYETATISKEMGWSRAEIYQLPVKEREYWAKWSRAVRKRRERERAEAIRKAQQNQNG